MLISISSGNGISEVCRALWHFLQWLEKERYSFEVVQLEKADCPKCYRSILLQSSDERFWELEGSHLWQSQSPFRSKHQRKNWYFSLKCYDEQKQMGIDKSQVTYQVMRSPKKGGQKVNTTNSGVRAIYKTFEAISYDERSQKQNKQVALLRLLQKIEAQNQKEQSQTQQGRWRDAKEIERGNPVKCFYGKKFKLSI
jgi:peptide chain release factor